MNLSVFLVSGIGNSQLSSGRIALLKEVLLTLMKYSEFHGVCVCVCGGGGGGGGGMLLYFFLVEHGI